MARYSILPHGGVALGDGGAEGGTAWTVVAEPAIVGIVWCAAVAAGHRCTDRIARPIISGICGTTALPNARSRSTRAGIP